MEKQIRVDIIYSSFTNITHIVLSPGAHGDIFTPFGTKYTAFELPALEESIFSLSAGLPLGLTRVLGYTVEPDLSFNSPHTHKVQTVNLVMWYTMVLQATKHHS